MCYIPWASYSFQFVACDFLGTLEKGNATAFAHDFYQYIVSSNMFSIHGLKIPIISKRSRLSQHFLPITHNYPQLPTITHYIWNRLVVVASNPARGVSSGDDPPALSGPILSTSRGIPWGLSICCKAKSSLHTMGQEHCAYMMIVKIWYGSNINDWYDY